MDERGASHHAPLVFPVVQSVVGPRVADVAAEVEGALSSLELHRDVAPGSSVAVAVGSRGIDGLAAAVRATVSHLRALGAEPFVVPAMGSHGGATAEGQAALLAGYGITEHQMRCPVRASMDVVEIARSPLGYPLLTDRLAHEADHTVVVNRVKPHTMFLGAVESGLTKMWLIGLGKHAGASVMHRAIVQHGWQPVIDDAVPLLLAHSNVRAGVALVERSDDVTARVSALRADRFLTDEPGLLRDARRWMARLPFDDVDVLLIDRIGKDISGAGLDTNVVGRKHDPSPPATRHRPEHDEGAGAPFIRTIVVRGLTSATRGNAIGIGHAELCRTRVLRDMDVATTRINALTALDLEAVRIPVDHETDRELLDIALAMIGLSAPEAARLLWVRDTLHLQRLWCSEPLRAEAEARGDLHVLGPSRPLPFDDDGNLPDDLPDDHRP